jgi:hypothetical protein
MPHLAYACMASRHHEVCCALLAGQVKKINGEWVDHKFPRKRGRDGPAANAAARASALVASSGLDSRVARDNAFESAIAPMKALDSVRSPSLDGSVATNNLSHRSVALDGALGGSSAPRLDSTFDDRLCSVCDPSYPVDEPLTPDAEHDERWLLEFLCQDEKSAGMASSSGKPSLPAGAVAAPSDRASWLVTLASAFLSLKGTSPCSTCSKQCCQTERSRQSNAGLARVHASCTCQQEDRRATCRKRSDNSYGSCPSGPNRQGSRYDPCMLLRWRAEFAVRLKWW